MVKSGSEPLSQFSTLRVHLAGQKHGDAPGEVDHCNRSLLVYPTNLTIALLFLKDICTETPHKSKPKHNFNVNCQLIHNLHEDSKLAICCRCGYSFVPICKGQDYRT